MLEQTWEWDLLKSKFAKSPGGILLVIGAFLVVIGLPLFGLVYLLPHREMEAAKQWRQTLCTIVSSQVKESHDSEGSSSYTLRVSYRYQSQDSAAGVNSGDELTNDTYNLWLTEAHGSPAPVQAIVDRLAPGTTVPCYYDPHHPRSSAIERAAPPIFRYFIWLGLFPVLGFGLLAAGLFRRRRSAAHPGSNPPPAAT